MELLNRFPKGFFNTPSPIAKPTKNPDDEILPIAWKSKKENSKKIVVKSTKRK